MTFACDNLPVDIFREWILHGNATRTQHFEINFEEDLRQAFRIIFRIEDTVETTSFATPTLDSPPLISMYYLPYKNGEVKKFVLY